MMQSRMEAVPMPDNMLSAKSTIQINTNSSKLLSGAELVGDNEFDEMLLA